MNFTNVTLRKLLESDLERRKLERLIKAGHTANPEHLYRYASNIRSQPELSALNMFNRDYAKIRAAFLHRPDDIPIILIGRGRRNPRPYEANTNYVMSNVVFRSIVPVSNAESTRELSVILTLYYPTGVAIENGLLSSYYTIKTDYEAELALRDYQDINDDTAISVMYNIINYIQRTIKLLFHDKSVRTPPADSARRLELTWSPNSGISSVPTHGPVKRVGFG